MLFEKCVRAVAKEKGTVVGFKSTATDKKDLITFEKHEFFLQLTKQLKKSPRNLHKLCGFPKDIFSILYGIPFESP